LVSIKNISDQKVLKSTAHQKVANVKAKDAANASQDSVMTMVDKSLLDKADKATKDKLAKTLKDDLNNDKYVLLYGTPENLTSEEVVYDTLQLPTGVITKFVDAEAKETAKRLFAYGVVKKADGSIHVDSYYAAPGKDLGNLDAQLDFITSGFKHALGIKDARVNEFNESNKVKPQSVSDDPDYTKTENFDYGTYGTYQSTGYFERMGYSTYSLWDAKYSDTSSAGYGLYSSSWYQVDQVVTRSSVEGFSSETIIDHGPTSTSSGSTATVNLTAAGPEVGWSWQLDAVDVIDDYHAINGYGRWVFDYDRWSNAAEHSYKSEPGARFKNTRGNMVINTSHTVDFWDNPPLPNPQRRRSLASRPMPAPTTSRSSSAFPTRSTKTGV
jgi:hypothetical protein